MYRLLHNLNLHAASRIGACADGRTKRGAEGSREDTFEMGILPPDFQVDPLVAVEAGGALVVFVLLLLLLAVMRGARSRRRRRAAADREQEQRYLGEQERERGEQEQRHERTVDVVPRGQTGGDADMVPVTVALSIAQQVMTNVLSDLISRKIRGVRSDEVEKQVNHYLARYSEEYRRDFSQLREQVLGEIRLLAQRDPGLLISRDQIELTGAAGQRTNEQRAPQDLRQHLDHLQAIIAQRRRELGLPVTPAEENADRAAASPPVAAPSDGAAIDWVQVRQSRDGSVWEQKIQDMEDRIRRRRKGEVLVDE